MNIFDERRAQLFSENINPVSQAILEHMPHMVAHPVPPAPKSTPAEYHSWCVQDFDFRGPIGCTPGEGYILNRAAALARPRFMLEIGSYVGWSAAHLLYGNQLRLTCVDSLREGTGVLLDAPNAEIVLRFHENMRTLDMESRVTLIPEESPACLEHIAPEGGWHFVFLDGWHFDRQPLRDIQGLLPFMHQHGVVFMHDLGLFDVDEAATYLVEQGWTRHDFVTPNSLGAFWKVEPRWWKKFLKEIA